MLAHPEINKCLFRCGLSSEPGLAKTTTEKTFYLILTHFHMGKQYYIQAKSMVLVYLETNVFYYISLKNEMFRSEPLSFQTTQDK